MCHKGRLGMKPDDFVTYSGLFCGPCARSPGFTAFRDATALI